jgi:hypothetical protein
VASEDPQVLLLFLPLLFVLLLILLFLFPFLLYILILFLLLLFGHRRCFPFGCSTPGSRDHDMLALRCIRNNDSFVSSI